MSIKREGEQREGKENDLSGGLINPAQVALYQAVGLRPAAMVQWFPRRRTVEVPTGFWFDVVRNIPAKPS